MDNKQIDLLLNKLVSGNYSPQEEQEARAFIHQYHAEGESGLTDEDFLEAQLTMWAAIKKAGRPKLKKIVYWKLTIAAAVALIIFGAGLFYFAKQKGVEQSDTVRLASDIAPGRNGATLTLSNGKSIVLSGEKAGVVIGDSDLKYDDETAVIPGQERNFLNTKDASSDAIEMTASTALGRTYQITLPDGSKVWLNAGSSITFPANFDQLKERHVKLSGEAYFEISKDKAHPFIVATDNQETTVLGTHFNINSYTNEDLTKTTLLEGSIRVSPFISRNSNFVSSEAHSVVLKPKQQAILSVRSKDAISRGGTYRLTVQPADTELELAWKNNDFYFKAEPMESVMRKVARWYNITVNYTDAQLKNVPISGFISRNKPISVLLDRLGAAGHMQFKIEGQTVTVIPK